MNEKKQSVYTVTVAAVLIFGLSLLCIFHPQKDFSESERRKLEKFPELSAETILSGKFMEDFEDYTLDQFPGRDAFRRIKAFAQYKVFNFKDNNGIYIAEDSAAKLIYPLNENSVLNAAAKFGEIYDKYLAGNSGKIFVSMVPDKGYFLAEQNGFPALDYAKMEKLLYENMPYAEYIDIKDTLSAGDYYRTDTHWRQEKIRPAAEKLAEALGFTLSANYTEKQLPNDFYGVYYGQAALPMDADKISYVTSEIIEGASVFNAETGKTGSVYDFEELSGADPYEFFLSGAAALLTIENPAAENEKELIIFRDSFGSSVAPYLIEGYSKITLVDIRYVASSMLGELVDFENADVLFLYSSLVLNESFTLK